MANEIQVSAYLGFSKDGNTGQRNVGLRKFTMTGNLHADHEQSVGITEEALRLGDIAGASLGFCLIENLDATNFVSLRRATGESDFMKIKAGEFCLFRFDADATAPFIIADTAAVRIRVFLLEN